MAQQSKLENIGITKRDELVMKNDYANLPDKEYSESHSDAKSDGDPLGKGSGVSMGYAVASPDDFNVDVYGNRSQKMNYSNIMTHETDTQTIGGSLDRLGRNDIPQSGRIQLMNMNKYQEGDGHEYGAESIDTSANLLAGQYIVQ